MGLRVALCAHTWHEAQMPELAWAGPSSAAFGWRRTEQALLDVVRTARERLWLVTFALYPVPSLKQELEEAIARGAWRVARLCAWWRSRQAATKSSIRA